VIWNHPTVTELAAHVLTRLEPAAAAPAAGDGHTGPGAPRSSTTVEQIVAASASLVDDDVLRLLMGGGDS
jgi:hypothetical protein